MAAATPLSSTVPLTPVATNSPLQGCPGTSKTEIATPLIMAGFRKHLTASTTKGTPPPHNGPSSAAKKRSIRKLRAARGSENAAPGSSASQRRVVPRGVTPKKRSRGAPSGAASKRSTPASTFGGSPASTASQAMAATPSNPCGAAAGSGAGAAEAAEVTPFVGRTPSDAMAAMRMFCGASKLTPQLPGRFLTPSFLAGGSDKRGTAQRAVRRRPAAGAGAGSGSGEGADDDSAAGSHRPRVAAATPRSFIRALSTKSRDANRSLAQRRRADAGMTPRTMVRKFIHSGLRTADLKADTPATRKRRAIRTARLEAEARVAAEAAARQPTAFQRLLRLFLFVTFFVALVIVMCHLSQPVRDFVQRQLFSEEAYGGGVRYT